MEPLVSSPPFPVAVTITSGPRGRSRASDGTAKTYVPEPKSIHVQVDAPSPEQVKQAIEAANEALRAASANLEFAQDPSTGKTVVKIVDVTTRQVIRQFPSEEMLSIARALDRLQGLLLVEKA